MNKQEQEVLKDLENKSQAWARIILRIIDKLQKENEELKEEIENWKFTHKYVEENYVDKNIIRDKIKEEMQTPGYITSLYAIGLLEEIIGETKDEE